MEEKSMSKTSCNIIIKLFWVGRGLGWGEDEWGSPFCTDTLVMLEFSCMYLQVQDGIEGDLGIYFGFDFKMLMKYCLPVEKIEIVLQEMHL